MSDSEDLIKRHNLAMAENIVLAEYAAVADIKIEQLESRIEQLETMLAMAQGAGCEG